MSRCVIEMRYPTDPDWEILDTTDDEKVARDRVDNMQKGSPHCIYTYHEMDAVDASNERALFRRDATSCVSKAQNKGDQL